MRKWLIPCLSMALTFHAGSLILAQETPLENGDSQEASGAASEGPGIGMAPAVPEGAGSETQVATAAEPPAADEPEKPANTFTGILNAASRWGGEGLSAVSGWGDGLRRSLSGNPVTLTDDQRGRLEGMRPALTGLAGADGMFNRGDLPDILSSMEPQLADRVREEISRRAEAKIDEGLLPFLRRPLVNMNVRNNYCNYFNGGMDQARGMLTNGLEEFFTGVGVEGTAPAGAPTTRGVTLDQLDSFRSGAETLRQIDRIRNAPVRVVFPRGFGVADLESILANPNQVPPNGVIRPR
ncbi:MAG: hypothetical protein HY303_18000 [Candidatus Wallbacteria bacterium]|nr:hypothetical protein [Candidatus Wallbacteria bacterium]